MNIRTLTLPTGTPTLREAPASPPEENIQLPNAVTLGTALHGEVTQDELQNLMAGGEELAELAGSLRGTV
jgi:hypothetical protein